MKSFFGFFSEYPTVRNWLAGRGVSVHKLLCEVRELHADLEHRFGDITEEEGPCTEA